MNRQPKHSELDSELMELDHKTIFPNSAIMSTVLTFIGCWAGLFAVMTAGWLRWQFWPYVTMPLLVWLVVLCWPWWRKARDISMGIMDAQIETIEAWTARAGYSIDLNGDGYIGRHTITVDRPPELVRPLIVSAAPQGLRLLASDAPAAFDAPGLDQVAATLDPPARRPDWALDNGATIDQVTLEQFIDGCFIRGWSRDQWVGGDRPLTRQQHDGLLLLFDRAGIIAGRGKGSPGKLTLHTAAAIKAKLRLTTSPPAPG